MVDIVNAVSVLGFPIVMCGAMAYFVKYQCDNYRSDINNLGKVVKDNTNVITKLMERMGGIDNETKWECQKIINGMGGIL